ncbi:MAG: ATP-binding protein [Terracidiphilus sp.]
MASSTVGLATAEERIAVPFASNHEYLLAEMDWLRLVMHREVLRLKAANLLSPDPFRGLYLSDELVDSILSDWNAQRCGTSENSRNANAAELTVQIEKARMWIDECAEASREHGRPAEMDRLTDLCGLSEFDRKVLIAAIAVDLDQHFEEMYAWARNDITRKRPSIGLMLKLFCSSEEEEFRSRAAFLDGGALVRNRLVRIGDGTHESEAAFLAKSVRIDDRIAAFLMEQVGIDRRLRGFASVSVPTRALSSLHLPPDLQVKLKNLEHLDEPAVFYLCGQRGAGKRAIVEALCLEQHRSMLAVDLGRVAYEASAASEMLVFIHREAMLQGAEIFFAHAEALLEDGAVHLPLRSALEALRPLAGQRIFIAGEEPWPAAQTERGSAWVTLDCPIPAFADRVKLWQETLAGMEFQVDPDVDAALLANRFALTGGAIQEACADAARRLRLNGQVGDGISSKDLEAAARAQSTGGLRRFAEKIQSRGTWESLVLPPYVVRQLRDVCTAERHRQTVYSEWGFDQRLTSGKGLNVLFCGPSGTGKTMAAGILAQELGLDLYRIDLSVVVSKYIGETEKQLNLIFREARASNAVLLFDEADALFGKRSEVKDAHDRYANVEVAYLLQKMEEYEGVVILATNLRRNMDDAFTRRMSHIVEFPFPDAEQRERIWRSIFPSHAPVASDVEFGFLARQFELAGGNIRNIAVAAAFLAAEKQTKIGMEQCIVATALEIQKTGKLPSRSEFRDYYEMIRTHI